MKHIIEGAIAAIIWLSEAAYRAWPMALLFGAIWLARTWGQRRPPRPARALRREPEPAIKINQAQWQLARDNGVTLGAGHWKRQQRRPPRRDAEGATVIASGLGMWAAVVMRFDLAAGIAMAIMAIAIVAIAKRR